MARDYGTGREAGLQTWGSIVRRMRAAGASRPYDCVIGVSGGTDSSYLVLLAKKWGLNPLAVHYDNTWNSAQAADNIRRITNGLGVDLFTYVVDNIEVDDIKLAFIRAGVREFDADTDIAFVQVLRSVAAKFRVKFILEGHSFVTEGLSPMTDNYLDGKYVRDVHSRFGTRKLKTFPNLTFWQFMKWIVFYRQEFVRPLWYLNYSKEEAKVALEKECGWVDYGGHHLENRASAFAHQIYLPQRFNIDYRILTLAARVRNGTMSRQEAQRLAQEEINPDPFLVRYACERMRISEPELKSLMREPTRTWRDFKTYKKIFELLRPMFFIFAKLGRVPMSFYLKYCVPRGNQS